MVAILLLIISFGCDQSYLPSNQLSDKVISESPELLDNLKMGLYSRLRESQYVRLRHFLQELPGDDLAWCKNSGDHVSRAYNYNRLVNSNSSKQFWTQAYFGIFQANKIIEIIEGLENQTELEEQIKGEAFFIRGLIHFDLVRIFSRPFSQNPDQNLGVIIANESKVPADVSRSSVKETFEFIENDFLSAAELLNENLSNIYASREAAWAMLSRIYLYMDELDKCLEFSDKVISSGKFELLSHDELPNYYRVSPESNKETIFAIKRLASESLGKSGIGSLYTREGWGEIFVTNTFASLIYQNENDARTKFIDPDYILDDSGDRILDEDDPTGFAVDTREGYKKYFNLKYTLQDDTPLLASPVVVRLAEMYLNKAEVYAKTEEIHNAIEMINIIRERAGLIDDQLYTSDSFDDSFTVLDAVLQERRLELCWEGHRSYDIFRNGRTLDRSFTNNEGWAGPRSVAADEKIIIPFIPQDEITLNPNLKQNP